MSVSSHNRRSYSSPNIIIASNGRMSTSSSGSGSGIGSSGASLAQGQTQAQGRLLSVSSTIREEDEDGVEGQSATIKVSRSDGVHHDLVSVFANPGIQSMISTSTKKTRAASMDETSSSGKDKDGREWERERDMANDGSNDYNRINITRSDGLSHDIVKVFRSTGESTRSAGSNGNITVSTSLYNNNNNNSNNSSNNGSTTNSNTSDLKSSTPAPLVNENSTTKIKANRSSTFAKIADLLTGKNRNVEKEKVVEEPSGRDSFIGRDSLSATTFRMGNEFFMKSVRIVHMSDTHNFLKASHRNPFLPNGNILVHSGNFSCNGKDEEFVQFNSWLESVADVYHYRIICLGHKDVKVYGNNFEAMRKLLPGATHVLCHEEVTVLGIRIYCCPWNWAHRKNYTVRFGAQGTVSGDFDDIPNSVQLLVTHGPAYARLDARYAADVKEHWGSRELAEAIRRARPSVHLHGHVKDSRGVIPAFGNNPLILNSCMTDVGATVLYAAPQVIKATQIMVDSNTNQASWAFSLDNLDG